MIQNGIYTQTLSPIGKVYVNMYDDIAAG
jgi:hypothetical protein